MFDTKRSDMKKKETDCLTSPWAALMMQRFVNLLAYVYQISYPKLILNLNNEGLCRDDWLALVLNVNSSKQDKLRKDIIALFKNKGFSITIEMNLPIQSELNQPHPLWDYSKVWYLSYSGNDFDQAKRDKRADLILLRNIYLVIQHVRRNLKSKWKLSGLIYLPTRMPKQVFEKTILNQFKI